LPGANASKNKNHELIGAFHHLTTGDEKPEDKSLHFCRKARYFPTKMYEITPTRKVEEKYNSLVIRK
jgi:hypothetical protein